MTKRASDKAERQRHWLAHLKSATAGGGSLAAYAAAHDIKLADLYRWKKRLTARGVWPAVPGAPAFVAVTASQTAVPSTQCTVTFPNGVRLELSVSLDGAQLQTLLRSVGSLR